MFEENELYKVEYKRASERALYILAKKHFGSLAKLADYLKVTRQYVQQIMRDGIPENYAGLLGRKFNIDPAIFNYEDALILGEKRLYMSLFESVEASKVFSTKDVKYVLKGTYVSNPKKYLTVQDSKTIGR